MYHALWLPVLGLVLAMAITLPAINTVIPMTTIFEQPEVLGVANVQQTVSDPAFLPHKIAQFAMTLPETSHTQLLMRLVSLAFGLAALWLVYVLLSKWHTRRIAALSALTMAASSWFLHTARWAEPDVLYLSVLPVLILASVWLREKRYDKLWPLSLCMLALVVYVPGAWLFVGIFFALNLVKINETFKNLSNGFRALSVFTFTILIGPLIYYLIQSPSRFLNWLGWPEVAPTLGSLWQNLYSIPKELFISGPGDALRWLGGTPILDVATIVLMIVGIYAYWVGPHPMRLRALAGLILISVAFISLGGAVSLSLLIPIVYIFVANGIAFLLQQWFTVFPRNPLARTLGLVAIAAVIASVCSYQLVRYYVAYPSAPATYQAVQKNSD